MRTRQLGLYIFSTHVILLASLLLLLWLQPQIGRAAKRGRQGAGGVGRGRGAAEGPLLSGVPGAMTEAPGRIGDKMCICTETSWRRCKVISDKECQRHAHANLHSAQDAQML